jgi:hypothetical protein
MMAAVIDILIRVRQRIGDTAKTKFSDEELFGYLNDAINFLSAELISLRDAEMVKVFTVAHGATGTAVPADYFSFVGEYPIYLQTDADGTKAYPLDSAATGDISVRYFAYKPKIDAGADTLPFNNVVYHTILSQLTAMYALNRNNVGVVQDAQFLDQIRAQLRAGKGVVTAAG